MNYQMRNFTVKSINMEQFLTSEFLHNTGRQWLLFVGVLVLILILAPLISKLLSRILYQFFKRTAPGKGEHFAKMLLAPLRAMIAVIALSITIQFMTFPPDWHIDFFGLELYSAYSHLMKLLIILAVAWVVVRTIDFIGELLLDKAKLTTTTQDDQYVLFIKDVFKVIVYIGFFFLILGGVFSLNITSLLAGAGLAGLAVALAAQDSLQNLLGSITIFGEKPFLVGDLIEINGLIGSVEKVGFRSTRIRTLEKTFVTIPNKTIMENPLNNLSERTLRRVSITVGLTYGTSVSKINYIVAQLIEYLQAQPNTTADPVVGLSGFGASSLDVLVQFMIKETGWSQFVKIREEILLQIMEIVEEGGSDFAFPTTTVHMIKEEESQ
jgi:MscS family membrane protein